MNIQKVKQKLDKVNNLYTYLIENQETISRVDRDSFLGAIRSLYDSCFEPASAPIPENKPASTEPTVEKSKKRPKLFFNENDGTTPATKVVTEVPTSPVVEPPQTIAPAKEPIVETPIVEQTPPPPTIEEKQEETPITNSTNFNEEYASLFHYKAATDLSQKLSTSKLDDLQKALGLNEKFLYINELFGGNIEQFQATIKTLNEGENFATARCYMEDNLIAQNKWMEKNRQAVAKDFIKLVRRRYA